jgi:hypothetical protein
VLNPVVGKTAVVVAYYEAHYGIPISELAAA